MEGQPRAAPALVGRDGELGELLAGIDDVASGRGRLFLLAGDPGIGKSRLAYEAAARARDRGIKVEWGGAGRPAGHRMFIRYLSPADIERIVGLWAHIREGRAAEVALGAGPRDDDRAVSLQTDLHD